MAFSTYKINNESASQRVNKTVVGQIDRKDFIYFISFLIINKTNGFDVLLICQHTSKH